VVFGEGEDQWWAHSILFPDDFAIPNWHMYVLMDFHQQDIPGDTRQANFHINFQKQPEPNTDQFGDLIFRGYGGSDPLNPNTPNEYIATIAPGGTLPPISKNVWYDFVYHVKWSSEPDGYFAGWVRKGNETFYRRVLDHVGPTLYPELGVYLKLANYHTPVCDPYPGCSGPASSVIHDRVVRGTTPQDVAMAPLEYWYEENDPIVSPIAGMWTIRGSEVATFSRGAAISSNTGGDNVNLTFTGTSVSWVGLKCNVCGIAAISIDGGAETLVDTYDPAAPGSAGLASVPLFTASGLTPGSHTVKIRVTGTHNANSTDNHVVLDRFNVIIVL
jgi:hypothetical protein